MRTDRTGINYTIRVVSFRTNRRGTTPPKLRVPIITFRVKRRGTMRLEPIKRTEDVLRIARQLIPDDAREHFGVLLLTTSNHIIGWHEIGIGGVLSVLSSSREVVGAALRTPGCAAFICLHNHPSGDPKPSQHDERCARDLSRAAKLFELRMHDYIIIGDGNKSFCSFDEAGKIAR